MPQKQRDVCKIIQWFPGHMAKAKREIASALPLVDIAIEICDARIPVSSRNPQIKDIIGNKPSLLILNKTSLADPEENSKWKKYFESSGQSVLFTDCITGQGINTIVPEVKKILKDKISLWESKGMKGRVPRILIIGITNSGKSSLVNKLCGSKRVKTEDRPGVTRQNQWISVKGAAELLDTPGILWPKFDDEKTGLHLAYTGAINDDILDKEEISVLLCSELLKKYPSQFLTRYKLSEEQTSDLNPYELFELVGRKRGFLISGGEVDYARTASVVLDEFRSAAIGRITLESPESSESYKT